MESNITNKVPQSNIVRLQYCNARLWPRYDVHVRSYTAMATTGPRGSERGGFNVREQARSLVGAKYTQEYKK